MKTKTRKHLIITCAGVLALALRAGVADGNPANLPVREKSYTGTVTGLDLNHHTLKVRGLLPFGKTFELGAACSYALLDGATDAANGLHAGQKITVIYQNADGVLVADRIVQERLQFEGYVKTLDPTAHTVTVQPAGFGVSRQFLLTGNSQVILLGDKPGTMADLQPGNHVTLTFETPAGMATAQKIAQTSQEFTGEITALDLDAKTVRAKSLFDTRSFNLGDHCVIDLDGKGGGHLRDLKPEERLVFTFDDINGVNVVNRIAPAKDGAAATTAANSPNGS